MNSMNLLTTVKSAYPNQGFDYLLQAPSNKQLLVHSIEAVNGSAATNSVAFGNSINSFQVSASQVASNYTISSKVLFDMVAFNIATADTSGSTFTYQYYNGSGYSTLSLINTPVLTVTGRQILFFSPPIDMAVDGSDNYLIRIVASGTPNYSLGTPRVCKTLCYRESVLPDASVQIDLDTRQLLLQQGEGLIGFFAFPSSSNTMEASYQINP